MPLYDVGILAGRLMDFDEAAFEADLVRLAGDDLEPVLSSEVTVGFSGPIKPGHGFGHPCQELAALAKDPSGTGLDPGEDGGLSGVQWGDDLHAEVGMDGDGKSFPDTAGKLEFDLLTAIEDLPGHSRGFGGGDHRG